MTNRELARIETRNPQSLDVAALINEVRLAWRCLDHCVQGRVDQDEVVDSLTARVAELESRQAGMPVALDRA
jgi:hypothetical protein